MQTSNYFSIDQNNCPVSFEHKQTLCKLIQTQNHLIPPLLRLCVWNDFHAGGCSLVWQPVLLWQQPYRRCTALHPLTSIAHAAVGWPRKQCKGGGPMFVGGHRAFSPLPPQPHPTPTKIFEHIWCSQDGHMATSTFRVCLLSSVNIMRLSSKCFIRVIK